MVQQINEITKMPSNSEVTKIINALIKRYNSLVSIYVFKGSVQTYDDLLAIQDPQIGDVYNIIQEDVEHGVAAGSNFVWDGTAWDNLGMSLDGLVRKINGFTPDDLGAVIFQYIKNIEDDDGTLTVTIRNGEEETQLTIQTGKVKTVNGVEPDDAGNIQLAPAIPVGTILALLDDEVPEGYLPAEGAEISRTTYADLFNVIGTKFGVGDGSTTFSLPNFVGRFLEGDGTPGTLKEPGLPNITGYFTTEELTHNGYNSQSGGALYHETVSGYVANGTSGTNIRLRLDASRFNNIYGAATTVQPKSITVKFIIKY